MALKNSTLGADRFLLTGATGFVGANLVRRLVASGGQVTVVTREGSRLWRLDGVTNRLRCVVADLSDSAAVAAVVSRAKPTVIFHLAAASIYGGLEGQEPEMVETNLIGTINLVRACADLDYRCFVNTGSSSEYGPKSGPMVETDLTQPQDIYSVTKCAATHYASAIARQENRPIVTLRLFSPFGSWDDPRKLIPTAIVAALHGHDIALASREIGRDYIYIDDVIEAYLTVIDRAQQIQGEIINVGSGREKTLAETIDAILELVGTRSRPLWEAAAGSQYDNPVWQASIEKAKRLLGWEPRVDFREGLRRTIGWLRKHQDLYP